VGLLQHHGERVRGARNHHQMNMVRHQAVAENGETVQAGMLPQQAKIHRPLRIGAKDKLPCVAALRHMVRNVDSYHAS